MFDNPAQRMGVRSSQSVNTSPAENSIGPKVQMKNPMNHGAMNKYPSIHCPRRHPKSDFGLAIGGVLVGRVADRSITVLPRDQESNWRASGQDPRGRGSSTSPELRIV